LPNFRERPQVKDQDIRDQINKFTKGGKFVIKNDNKVTAIDADNISFDELVDLHCTLLKVLKEKGILE